MSFQKISITLNLQEVRELESQFSLPHAKFAERLKKSKKLEKKLFAVETCLGKGSFGQVYKAKFARDVDVAIKVHCSLELYVCLFIWLFISIVYFNFNSFY
jgi:hypothetical protein